MDAIGECEVAAREKFLKKRYSEPRVCRVFYHDSTMSYYECPRPGDSPQHVFCCDNGCCSTESEEQQLQFYAAPQDDAAASFLM